MTVARDIASARALFGKAELEVNPELKALALDEALALLASCDPDEVTDTERDLIANLRVSNARRLLSQLVSPTVVSMDAWFAYSDLLFGELRNEIDFLVASDDQLRETYENFIQMFGPEVADLLKGSHEPG